MTKDCMIDFETAATSPDAVVLTVGAVHFNPYGNGYGDTLYMRINIDEQEAYARVVDPNTLDWWGKQDSAVMEEAFSPDDRVPFVEAIDRLHKFLWGCDHFWSHGATFDLVIIEDIYRKLGKPFPWQFWNLRCTRTKFDQGVDPDMPKGGLHNALQDSIRQAIGVQNVNRKLNIRQH